MLKMVHGSKSESLLWPMVRYGQVSGNDEVCRGIIMAHLGEPIGDVDEMCRKYDGIQTDLRDVGVHGQTVARLLHSKQQECQDVTVAMLVKEWRAKPEKAAPWYVIIRLRVSCNRIVLLEGKILRHRSFLVSAITLRPRMGFQLRTASV